mgnify:CR=1 FL=1
MPETAVTSEAGRATKSPTPRFSVVIPAYNEADALPPGLEGDALGRILAGRTERTLAAVTASPATSCSSTPSCRSRSCT